MNFLIILTHFLSRLNLPDDGFSPSIYNPLLVTGQNKGRHPLWVHDPLDIIKKFCETLEELWEPRDALRGDRFKAYRYHCSGIPIRPIYRWLNIYQLFLLRRPAPQRRPIRLPSTDLWRTCVM